MRAGIPVIDELDRALIAQLLADARRSNRALADAVGASPTTTLDRIRRLQQRGVVLGATVEVSLPGIGRGVQALIAVRVRPPSRQHIEAFRDWAAEQPEVLAVFVTAGAEDFTLHLAVPDNEAVYAFVVDRLTTRREVADIRTSIVYEHLRNRPHPLPAGA